MDKHTHQFFEISKISDEQFTGAIMSHIYKTGVSVMCAICGEVRYLWADHKLEIIKNGEHG